MLSMQPQGFLKKGRVRQPGSDCPPGQGFVRRRRAVPKRLSSVAFGNQINTFLDVKAWVPLDALLSMMSLAGAGSLFCALLSRAVSWEYFTVLSYSGPQGFRGQHPTFWHFCIGSLCIFLILIAWLTWANGHVVLKESRCCYHQLLAWVQTMALVSVRHEQQLPRWCGDADLGCMHIFLVRKYTSGWSCGPFLPGR